MENLLYNFNHLTNQVFSPLDEPYVRSGVLLFLILYGGLAAPAFPANLRSKVDNVVVRILWLAGIVWIAKKDPGIAIASAVVFIVLMNLSGGKSPFENFENFEGPATAIYPGCMNIKMYDLLESFKNDKAALLNAMLVARVPGDVKLTDYYAPLIATYLLNKGFALKAPCAPPGVEQRTGAWM